MSLAQCLLNPWLRLTEKRGLVRETDPAALRRSFETKTRLFFHAPRGTAYARETVAGVPVQWVAARGVTRQAGPLLLYFHGGGYVFGSSDTHRAMLARLSAEAGLPACLPDYRLAPEHPFPAAIEDALAVWRAVAERPGGVVLGGDSAGGGLALAALGEILRQGLPQPKGLFAFSPLTDFTFSGESLRDNAAADVVLPASRAEEIARLYLRDAAVDDPRASPLFADFTGAPPVWLTAGDTEILLDDTRRMAARLRSQGGCGYRRDRARPAACLADVSQHPARGAGEPARSGGVAQVSLTPVIRKLAASATWKWRTVSAPSRSAIVRATRSTR